MNIIIDCNDVILTATTAKGRVSAHDGDRLLHEDRIDLIPSSSRRRFAKTVAEKLELPEAADTIEALLLEKLDILRSAAAARGAPAELDISRIVRPELFVTSDLVGLSVPVPTIVDGRPAGRWRLYLAWPDDRREVRDMTSDIELSGDSRLWLHPEPTPPPAELAAGWGSAARAAWLAGAPNPDPAAVFKRLCEAIGFYLDLPKEHAAGIASTLALWTILTYVYPAWDAVPYLYLGGPAGSGKSRAFDILARIAYRPTNSSNMTASSLFRRLHDRGGTLLLDEAERLRESTPDASELRCILLAGYKRGGKATRNEPLGDGRFRQIEFDVFGPKAVACIAGVPAALASRCIPIMMFRSPPGSLKPRHRVDDDPHRWQSLRDNLHALALGYGPKMLEIARRRDVCPTMSGRNFELWQPLMALASWLEECGAEKLLDLVARHALEVIENSADDQTPDVDEILLHLIADAVRANDTPTPAELLAQARVREAETFRSWTAKGVSTVLKRYGIVSHRSNGRRVFNRVTLDDLARIERSYGIDLGVGTDDVTFAADAPLSVRMGAPR